MGKSATKKTICQVDGCGDKVLAKNYCCKHYYQYKRHGCISNTPRRKKTHCLVEGCDRPHYSRGYCSRHYQQLLKKNSLMRESPNKRTSKVICYAAGCKNTVFASGYCRLHYIKMKSLEMLAEVHPEWVVLNNNRQSESELDAPESMRSERKNSYDDNLKEAFALIDNQF